MVSKVEARAYLPVRAGSCRARCMCQSCIAVTAPGTRSKNLPDASIWLDLCQERVKFSLTIA